PARACPPASTACHQESSAQVTSLQVNNAGTLAGTPVIESPTASVTISLPSTLTRTITDRR
ncbi:hypothetical protein, partial [Mycobacterium marinum]